MLLGVFSLVIGAFFLWPNAVDAHGLRTLPENFRIAIIADHDKLSKRTTPDGKTDWHSKYMTVGNSLCVIFLRDRGFLSL